MEEGVEDGVVMELLLSFLFSLSLAKTTNKHQQGNNDSKIQIQKQYMQVPIQKIILLEKEKKKQERNVGFWF